MERYSCLKYEVFKIVNKMVKLKQGMVGEKCVYNDLGVLTFDDDARKGGT